MKRVSFFKGRLIFVIFSGEDCDKNKYLYTQISVLKHFVYMGGIYGGKDIRPISQKQDSLHGLINTILDKLPLGVFVKDAEDGFRYLYWNRFMEEITGIGTEEVEGHNDFELSFDAIMPAEERLGLDRDVMETGRTIEFSGKISDAYGIPKDIEVTKFPIALSNGKPLLLALWRDVTVRNKMENTLRRSQVLTKMALHSNDIRTLFHIRES